MKRHIPILLALSMGLAIATCNAFGQMADDWPLVKQVQSSVAEAVAPGPAYQTADSPAPAHGDLQALNDRLDTLEIKVLALTGKVNKVADTAAKLDRPEGYQKSPYETRLDAIEKQHAENKEMMQRLLDSMPEPGYWKSTPQPAGTARSAERPAVSAAPYTTGANPVSETVRPQSMAVEPETTTTVWRPRTSTVRYSYPVRVRYSEPVYYDASYSNSYGSSGGYGSAGGFGGYSSSYHPTYSSGYSSGAAVYCVDAYGNVVNCN